MGNVLAAAVLLYATYGAVMVWLHPQFIYPFSQEPFVRGDFEVLTLTDTEVGPVTAYAQWGRGDQPVVIYFMGNIGAVEVFRSMLEHHEDAGRGIIAMAYPGGGGLAGSPSEQVLKAQALVLFDAVKEMAGERPVFLQGFSLGSGIAMHVAARREVAGVILEAPYDRMCILMARASYLPACWLPVQRWNSLADASDVSAPVLILHGTDDPLIPPERSVPLAEALSGQSDQVTRTLITGAVHNNLMSFPPHLDAIDRFLAP